MNNWNHVQFTNKRNEFSATSYTLKGFATREELAEYQTFRENVSQGYSPSFKNIRQEPDGLWSCEFKIYDSCD